MTTAGRPRPAGRSRTCGLTPAALLLVLAAPLPAQQQPVRTITPQPITPAITLLASHPDGNMLVVKGAAGSLLVDALSPELAARADSAIRAAADGVPRWVVNTHYHADHIGANGRLAEAGATTYAHAAVPRLAARDTTIPELQWDLDPAAAANLPKVTVDDSLSIDLGGDVARLIHLPNAHTAGDLIVRIERANVLHTGDIVEFGAYPFIDWWAGGSYDGLLAAADRILALTDDRTRIVPGHGRVLARADVVAYRTMVEEVGTRVREAIAAGEAIDAIVERRITARWDAEHGGERHGDRFVRLLHHEFTKGRRPTPASGGAVTGTVRTADGRSAAGALVTVRPRGATFTHTVIADADGRFRLPGLAPGEVEVAAGWGGPPGPAQTISIGARALTIELEAGPVSAGLADLPASALLAMLPDGMEKRRFIRDCTNCHVFDARIAFPQGMARTHPGWMDAVTRMLSFSGPQSSFPVIAEGRDPTATADWLTERLTSGARPAAPPRADAAAAGAIITEYVVPAPQDLPHDVGITADGRVLVTGMFTHRMYILDPATGEFATESIPVPGANPRAVEVAPDGAWWVVLGAPNALARRSPSGEWTSWSVGTYPHSLTLGGDGRVWYNGHFTSDPEVVGWLDPATGAVTRLSVPVHPEAHVGAGPIPYELRTGPDGRIWGSELVGDRIFAYDPATSRFRVWELPDRHLAPRRLDIDPHGIVWIPEYAGGHLTRFDPTTGEFRRIAPPVADAAPYVARVDRRTGRVWVGTGNADVILAYDPPTDTWTTYPLPSRATLVRHLAVDPRNGDLWIAYGASPGPPAKVARLRVR